MKSKYCSLIFVISLFIQSIVHAQLPSLEESTLIRLTTTRNPQPIIASVGKISADSLSCFVAGRLFEFSVEEIEKIETKTKPKRHTAQGALFGAVPGAIILGAISYATGSDEPSFGPSFTKSESALMGATLGALSGGIIGGLIGHAKITKDWQQIYPEKRVKIFIPGEKSPFLAFAQSLLLPGLGQYYNGDIPKGIIQDVLFIGGIFFAAKSSDDNSTQERIGGGLALGASLWSLIDAPISANKKNQQLKRSRIKNESLYDTKSIHLRYVYALTIGST